VTWGLGIRINNRLDGTSSDRVFSRFPVRIGRNALNDLQLQEAFVSQFHLVLELQDNRLWLRDLGSTNGTQLKGQGRAPANQIVDLAQCGFEFSIVNLDFRTYTAPVDAVPAAQPSQRQRLGVTSMLKAAEAQKLAAVQSAQKAAVAAPAPQLAAPRRNLYAAYRAACSDLVRSVDGAVTGLPVGARSEAIAEFAREFVALNQEPDFQALMARHGVTGTPGAGHGLQRAEAVALEGVRELAQDFCPKAGPLESVDDLVKFVERVQQVLDVFLRSFISMRDGQRQFEVDMAVRRSSVGPHNPAEAAQTLQELSQALLDWHVSSTEGIVHVESTLADLMIHQVALLNGVMSGVRTLLHEFSPAEIEKKAQDERFNPGGLGIGPYRYKSLWKTLEKMHADFTGEDKQVFSVLFGKQFAQAYEKYFGPAGRTGNRPVPTGERSSVNPGGGQREGR
jgi:type VI secretion system protein ImpI